MTLLDAAHSLDEIATGRQPARARLLAGALALDTLRRWGGQPELRQEALSGTEAITFSELALARYEAERPLETEACRVGDARFMPPAAARD